LREAAVVHRPWPIRSCNRHIPPRPVADAVILQVYGPVFGERPVCHGQAGRQARSPCGESPLTTHGHAGRNPHREGRQHQSTVLSSLRAKWRICKGQSQAEDCPCPIDGSCRSERRILSSPRIGPAREVAGVATGTRAGGDGVSGTGSLLRAHSHRTSSSPWLPSRSMSISLTSSNETESWYLRFRL